jgi:Integrase core domain
VAVSILKASLDDQLSRTVPWSRQSLILEVRSVCRAPALEHCGHRRGVQLDFIWPGKPAEDAFIESLHGRLRDEWLKVHQLTSIRCPTRRNRLRFRGRYARRRPPQSSICGPQRRHSLQIEPTCISRAAETGLLTTVPVVHGRKKSTARRCTSPSHIEAEIQSRRPRATAQFSVRCSRWC